MNRGGGVRHDFPQMFGGGHAPPPCVGAHAAYTSVPHSLGITSIGSTIIKAFQNEI